MPGTSDLTLTLGDIAAGREDKTTPKRKRVAAELLEMIEPLRSTSDPLHILLAHVFHLRAIDEPVHVELMPDYSKAGEALLTLRYSRRLPKAPTTLMFIIGDDHVSSLLAEVPTDALDHCAKALRGLRAVCEGIAKASA